MAISVSEGSYVHFTDGKLYRISIRADGSPRFVEANPLPTTAGIYTIAEPGRNARFVRLVLDEQGRWHRLDLYSGVLDHLPNAPAIAERAHKAGTLNLVHARDDKESA